MGPVMMTLVAMFGWLLWPVFCVLLFVGCCMAGYAIGVKN